MLEYESARKGGIDFYIEKRRVWVRSGATLPPVCLACGTDNNLEKIDREVGGSDISFSYYLCQHHAQALAEGVAASVWLHVLGGIIVLAGIFFMNGKNPIPGYLIQMAGLLIIVLTFFLIDCNVRSFDLLGIRDRYVGLRGLKPRIRALLESKM